MATEKLFYCSKCYRKFATLDHFNRYANKQLVSPCAPVSLCKQIKLQKDERGNWRTERIKS